MGETTYDLEIALAKSTLVDEKTIEQLKKSFDIEDKTESGWGLVLRLPEMDDKSFLKSLNEFVSKTHPFKEKIREAKPLLRIAVFTSNASCTLLINDLCALENMGFQLEISFYPCN